MKQAIRIFMFVVLAASLGASGLQQATGSQTSSANSVLARALDVELGQAKPAKYEGKVSSGTMYALLEGNGIIDQRAEAAAARGARALSKPNLNTATLPPSTQGTQGCQNDFSSPGLRDTRVNQDCSLRRQAEEVVAINPTNALNLIAGQNDSRTGFNRCGYDWSLDGGKTWGDQTPPFYQFIMADGHTADACSDPTVTFDADGNAYIAGVLFDINSAASAFIVAKSNAGLNGTFFHSPKAQAFQTYRDTPLGTIANDNDPNIFNDKEFIVADASKSSPKKNNVYGTWTRFNGATGAGVGGNSPIYFSQSTDGGATWSAGVEISGANVAACTAFSGEANANACDQDQGSHPIVGRDGTVYVAFGNGNTPTAGINQHMVVSCPPTSDCSQSASWTAPVKISDDYGTQPFGPDNNTACSAGRQCLPPNGYRMDDFVEGSLSVDNSGALYFTWADFRNGAANCNPNGPAATATPPCDNDVFYSYSTDHGATWSAAFDVTPAAKLGANAQWMPWSAVTPDGSVLWIAYYDRSYGNCETTGCNDISLAMVRKPASSKAKVGYQRLTTSSMPNLVPANNPLEAGFLGDYMWVTVDPKTGQPLITWADTRGLNNTVEEDIYFTRGPKP